LFCRRKQIQGVWEQAAEENICTKREEIMEGWRKLHSEELHNQYSSNPAG
jgi:hypothetical protein